MALLLRAVVGEAQSVDTPIHNSRYTIDLYEGQALGGTRMTALGGSYVAIAEDVDGSLQNPAAPAVRLPYSVVHFDYGLSIGITYPFVVRDLFNTGGVRNRPSYDDTEFFFVAPSLQLQFGKLGFGVNVRGQSYRLDRTREQTADQQELRAQFFNITAQVAYQFVDGQLILGGGARLVIQRVVAGPGAFLDNELLYTSSGFGLEAGLLFRPNEQRYRLGAALRTGIESQPNPSDRTSTSGSGNIVVGGNFFLPRSMVRPWELDVGAAYQFGPRPTNPRWVSLEEFIAKDLRFYAGRRAARLHELHDRLVELKDTGEIDTLAQRLSLLEEASKAQAADDRALEEIRQKAKQAMRTDYRGWDREYLLISASLLITGSVPNAVGLESFLLQTTQRSGESVVVSPRVGAEAEVWPNRLKARAGGYLEPGRLESSSTRIHATLGFDVALFNWDVFGVWPEDYIWQFTGAVDLARDYFVWSIGFGGWY